MPGRTTMRGTKQPSHGPGKTTMGGTKEPSHGPGKTTMRGTDPNFGNGSVNERGHDQCLTRRRTPWATGSRRRSGT